MNKELKKLEELLANDRKIIEENYKEIERLNKKIEQYENPEDMTLMFMWCDEKAKDEIKRLKRTNNEIFKANETLAEEIKKLQTQLQQKRKHNKRS